MSSKKSWDEMSRQERVDLLLEDSDAYIDKVPQGHWLGLLDGIAKLPAFEPDSDSQS